MSDRAKVADAVRRGYKSLAYFDNHDQVALGGDAHESVGLYPRTQRLDDGHEIVEGTVWIDCRYGGRLQPAILSERFVIRATR